MNTRSDQGEKWQIQNRYQSLYICVCHQLSIFHTVITVHFCVFRSHFICGFWENLIAAQAGCKLTTAEDDFELLLILLLPFSKWWDYRGAHYAWVYVVSGMLDKHSTNWTTSPGLSEEFLQTFQRLQHREKHNTVLDCLSTMCEALSGKEVKNFHNSGLIM